MGTFKDRAVSATSISKIMEGRVKISNDELMTKYPDGVTILGFDWMKGDDGKYPVCIFEENGNECFCKECAQARNHRNERQSLALVGENTAEGKTDEA